jgi:carboxyl-terminal processing protease
MASRKSATALLVGILLLGTLTLPGGAADGEAGQEGQVAHPADSLRKDSIRFAEWVLDAARILAAAHVKEPDEREMTGWAARGLWERFNRTTPPELKRLLGRVKSMGRRELQALLIDVRLQLGRRAELDDFRDVDIALEGIFRYLEPGLHQEPVAEQLARGSGCVWDHGYVGLGLLLRRHAPTGMLEVETPILDGPGHRAGIQAGDLITKITFNTWADGRPLPEAVVFSTKDLSVEEVNPRLRGVPGTKVKLTVLRPGAAKEVTVEVTRGRIELETVLGARRKKDDRWDHLLDPQKGIAYVRLRQLGRHTPRDLETALRESSKAGLKGLVLDLRSTPGGLLDCAINVADLFIDDGTIVSIRGRGIPEMVYAGHRDRSWTRFPLVCLVNAETKSTAELVAACLQDHGRALILGERTPGDIQIRSILPWRDGAELLVTTAAYYRPSGKNLAKRLTSGRDDADWGVRPEKGFALRLSSQERAALHEHLRRLEIIPRRDGAVKEATPRVRDRQLETALAYLRRQVEKADAAPPRVVRERDWLRPVLSNRPR